MKALFLSMLLGLFTAVAAQAAPAPRIVGADISHLPQLEAAGAKFYDHDAKAVEDLLLILKRNGVNRIRLKVWNEPGKYAEFPSDQSGPEGYNNPAHVVAMAKRAEAAGLKVMIDFHYSDWWADPGKQTMPVAWRNLDAAAVSEKLYAFTRDVMQQLKDAGVTPAEVQVGNEISNGMMWPLGRVPEWDNLAIFIKAGARAVKEVSPSSRVVLHLDAGGDNARCRRWFDAMLQRGVSFDVIGLSFYPVWHGALADLKQNMDDLSERYAKPLIVVETAYPWTTQNGDSQKNIYTSTGSETYPMTRQGQQQFLTALWQTVKAVPQGRGEGVIYWEPDFIPQTGAGWKAGAGDEWDNVTLFDFQGRALPGLKTFAEAAR